MKRQLESGAWAVYLDQPVEQCGLSEKATAIWSLLLYRLYGATGDERYLAAARKALTWCLKNQYAGPDPEARGSLVGVSPYSGIGYRPWFRIASNYASAYFGMAVIEELRLAGERQQQ